MCGRPSPADTCERLISTPMRTNPKRTADTPQPCVWCANTSTRVSFSTPVGGAVRDQPLHRLQGARSFPLRRPKLFTVDILAVGTKQLPLFERVGHHIKRSTHSEPHEQSHQHECLKIKAAPTAAATHRGTGPPCSAIPPIAGCAPANPAQPAGSHLAVSSGCHRVCWHPRGSRR